MDDFIFLFGTTIALFCIILLKSSDKNRKHYKPMMPSSNPIYAPYILPTAPNANVETRLERTPNIQRPPINPTPFTPRQPEHQNIPYRTMNHQTTDELPSIQNWRRSIAGLIRLADQNMRYARTNYSVAKLYEANQYAATAVENMSRALIHCFGEKPDETQDQTDPLRLISSRLDENERKELEETFLEIKLVNIVIEDLHEKAESTPREMVKAVESAVKACRTLKKIIVAHFAAEIPEITVACPKCNSLEIFVSLDKPGYTNNKCLNCFHEWSENNS